MILSPLSVACPHLATSAETHRDPSYRVCGATTGAPCVWAKRWDGVANPAFHSERLEVAYSRPPAEPLDPFDPLDPKLIEKIALASGLV